jgi:hypothetical protein
MLFIKVRKAGINESHCVSESLFPAFTGTSLHLRKQVQGWQRFSSNKIEVSEM